MNLIVLQKYISIFKGKTGRKDRGTDGQRLSETREHKFDSIAPVVGRMGCMGVCAHVGGVSGEIKEHPNWLYTRMFLISMVFTKGKK